MIGEPDSDLTPVPTNFREITWEIGEAELQKSSMALETFELLRSGETNVERIRNAIRSKRKLYMKKSTGKWTEAPSDRFVNEHVWVLAKMNKPFGMIPPVNNRTRQTSLLPGADEKLSAVVKFFKSNEPFKWERGPYKKAPGW
jgi:hypothetical protein